jgi:hypothetical protein
MDLIRETTAGATISCSPKGTWERKRLFGLVAAYLLARAVPDVALLIQDYGLLPRYALPKLTRTNLSFVPDAIVRTTR